MMLISVLVMLNNINTLILSHFLKRIQYDQLCEILKFHTIFLIFTFHFQILLSYSFFLLLKKNVLSIVNIKSSNLQNA